MTAVVGGAVVKLLDIVAAKYLKKRRRVEERVRKLIDHIDQYGELAQLYRFFAYVSVEVEMDESGQPLKDEHGNRVTKSVVLEPEARFEDAIRQLEGTDINSAISQKVALIRLRTNEATDLAMELDSSGALKEKLTQLYLKTVLIIETVLKHKSSGKPLDKFNEMTDALAGADEIRQELRKLLKDYL